MIIGCSSPPENKAPIITDTLPGTAIKEISTSLNSTKATSGFDVNKFLALADSFLTIIEGKEIHFVFVIDTIKTDELSRKSFYNALHPSDKTLIRRYSFDPGDGHRLLRLWFIDASYSDTADLHKAFTELKAQSGEVAVNDYYPGLTYTNDYVIRTNKNIYWLNSGCPYAFFNHQKLNEFVRQSLQLKSIADSIHCKCGQPKCQLAKAID